MNDSARPLAQPSDRPADRDIRDSDASRAGLLSPFYLELRRQANALGIDDFGIVPVGEAATFSIFADAVRRGATAGLSYLEKDVDARRVPRSVLADARSMIVVVLSQRRLRETSGRARAALLETLDSLAANAPQAANRRRSPTCGIVLDYAVSLDYHDVLRRALKRLQTFFRERFPNAAARAAVDTAPILEKDWAARAGLGFCGLHSLLIHRRFGSRLFLGELLVSTPFEKLTGAATLDAFRAAVAALDATSPVDANLSNAADCLSCRRCVDACPTGALVGDRTLDARRCLNFWTIENRAEIPPLVARRLDGRLFGCDRCQRVCPWNADDDSPPPSAIDLATVDALDDATFRRLFKKTPIFRARLDGLRRVAAALRSVDDQNKEE